MLQGRRGPVIVGAIFLALAVLMLLFLVLPELGKVSDAQDELAAAEAQTGTLESQLAALEQAEAAAPEARDQIQTVDQQIPPTLDQPGYLLMIKNAGAQASLQSLTTLTTANPTLDPATGLSTVPVAITAAGSYFSLTEFLYNLETLPRAAKVLNVTMSPGASASTTTTTTTTTTTLQMEASVILFTSDQSAGPGSVPGPTEDAAATGG